MFDSMLAAQVVDLGLSPESLEAYLVSSGFWGNPTLRERHGFQLSPSAFVLTPDQRDELERLATTTHGAVRQLNETLVSYAARHTKLTNAEAAVLKRAKIATRGLLSPYDAVAAIPPVLKVDLVLTQDGHFRIVEVDSYNPRGFGYAALLERSLPEELQNNRFPGVAGLGNLITASNPNVKTWYLLVSEFERYYETSARIFVKALRDLGISAELVREQDLYSNPQHPVFQDPAIGLLVIPDTIDKNPIIRKSLVFLYREGKLATFYPPLSYLGSKGFLPDLRQVPGMEEFIPRTTLMGRKYASWNEKVNLDAPLVLKATVSSGMKQVYFSDLDGDDFSAKLEEVSRLPGSSWILQEQVAQPTIPITVFDGQGNRRIEQHFLRVTAYVSAEGVVDAEVTGRPDRKVHGAPDCTQIPILTS